MSFSRPVSSGLWTEVHRSDAPLGGGGEPTGAERPGAPLAGEICEKDLHVMGVLGGMSFWLGLVIPFLTMSSFSLSRIRYPTSGRSVRRGMDARQCFAFIPQSLKGQRYQ